MSLEPPVISTERLVLRLANQSDVPAIINFYSSNKAHFAPYHPLWPTNYLTQEFWEARVAQYQAEFRNGQSLRLFIFPKHEPETIFGNANFTTIQRGVAQSCNLGYNLSASAQGQGYMHEALVAALAYVFGTLQLHRVMAQYLPSNQRSANVLKNLGFEVEGFARQYLLLSGEWQDHILSSLINSNWQPLTHP